MEKPLPCTLGIHSFENMIRGKKNRCKVCGEKIYVKTLKEEIEVLLGDEGFYGLE